MNHKKIKAVEIQLVFEVCSANIKSATLVLKTHLSISVSEVLVYLSPFEQMSSVFLPHSLHISAVAVATFWCAFLPHLCDPEAKLSIQRLGAHSWALSDH